MLGTAGFARGQELRIVPAPLPAPELRPVPVPGHRELNVDVWTDAGRGAVVHPGERVNVYFRTTRDAYVALYDVDLRAPVLTFSDSAMPERIDWLREQGHRFVERLPRGMDPRGTALLEAPEGSWLLLTTSAECVSVVRVVKPTPLAGARSGAAR